MCRNIKQLANFEPPAHPEEVQAAALQFVRKISGTPRPAGANAAAFDRAVQEIAAVAEQLLAGWVSHSPARDRDVELAKAKARSVARFG
jgi:hypothetical protein